MTGGKYMSYRTRRSLSVLLLCQAFTAFVPAAFSAERSPLLLTDGLSYDFVCHYADYATDPGGLLSIADVTSPEENGRFVKMTGNGFVPGDRRVVWLRFYAENRTASRNEWILEYDYFRSGTELTLYDRKPDGAFLAKRFYPGSPVTDADIPYRNPLFRLSIEPGTGRTFYVRAAISSDTYLVLKMWHPVAFVSAIRIEQLLIGIFLGIMCIMAIYNLFLFFSFRDTSYLYYVLFIASLAVLQLNNHRVVTEWFPVFAQFDATITTLFKLLTLVAFFVFSRSFLLVARHFPRSDKAVRILVYAVVATGLLALSFPVLKTLNSVFLGASGVLVLLLAIMILKKGNRSALFFLVAMAALVASGVLVLIPTDVYYVKSLDFFAPYYIDFGSISMVVLFSFGLAYRINTLCREQEHVERLKELDRAKSRFFTNISHEFRTPLTLISGPLEDMLEECGEPRRRRKLEMMIRNTEGLLSLINQLLELSKLESGRMTLKAYERDIVGFAKGIFECFTYTAARKGLGLSFDSADGEIRAYFDPEKMEKVFLNLFVNALKFSPPGGSILFRISRKEAGSNRKCFPDGYAECTVTNTGIGIPEEHIDRVFERFYRAENPLEPGHEGSGVGLALAKELVRLHRGTIDAASSAEGHEEERYTSITIRLPLGRTHLSDEEISSSCGENSKAAIEEYVRDYFTQAETQEDTVSGPAGTEQPGDEKDTVLIIEDNPDVRAYLREGLCDEYAITEAKCGEDGLMSAQSTIPDIVLCDIMMPGMDGYAVCRALKEGLDTSHIPVVLLTAKAGEENVVLGLECGADDYVTKPFNMNMVRARIRNLVALRNGFREKIRRQLLLQPTEPAVTSTDERFIGRMHELIDENLGDPDFSIDALANGLFMSKATLNRKIRALTGQSTNQYVQSYRLKTAAQLLRSGFGNVTEVCYKVGFTSTAYFTKCFKETFHQLPSHY